MGGLTLIAFAVIAASAEPFAEAMVQSGRILGIDEFLLIQWPAPLASEAPAVTIAVLFVLANRAVSGLTAMIGDKLNIGPCSSACCHWPRALARRASPARRWMCGRRRNSY